MRRAVVTGLGAVTPLGPTLPATLEALRRGDEPEPALFDAAGFSSSRAYAVRDFDARRHFSAPKALKLCDRRTRLAVAASAMARQDAGDPGDRERLGVLVGTSGSDLGAEELSRALGSEEPERCAEEIPLFARRVLSGVSPLWLLVHLPNMASAHVAIQLGARGPNSTVMTGWAAGLSAIVEGADLVRQGIADACLAGGAECGLHSFAFAGLEQAGLLGSIAPAEGAAMLHIEDRERALSRGARIYGEILEGTSGAGEPAPLEIPELAGRTGHLFAALAPLELALALLEAGRDEVRVEARGPSGEWAWLLARAAARAAFPEESAA